MQNNWVLWGKDKRIKSGFWRNKGVVKIAEYLPFDMERSHEMISRSAGVLVGGDDGVSQAFEFFLRHIVHVSKSIVPFYTPMGHGR